MLKPTKKIKQNLSNAHIMNEIARFLQFFNLMNKKEPYPFTDILILFFSIYLFTIVLINTNDNVQLRSKTSQLVRNLS